MSEQPRDLSHWPNGATWPQLTYAQRRRHIDPQLNSNIQPYWKRVLLACAEHGVGWA
jgi:hypothetical protein